MSQAINLVPLDPNNPSSYCQELVPGSTEHGLCVVQNTPPGAGMYAAAIGVKVVGGLIGGGIIGVLAALIVNTVKDD